MGSPRKLVMQATVDAQEFPGLFEDLAAMRDGRRRASKLLRMAYLGWLVEQGRVGTMAGAMRSTPAPREPPSRSRIGCTIEEFVDFADSHGD